MVLLKTPFWVLKNLLILLLSLLHLTFCPKCWVDLWTFDVLHRPDTHTYINTNAYTSVSTSTPCDLFIKALLALQWTSRCYGPGLTPPHLHPQTPQFTFDEISHVMLPPLQTFVTPAFEEGGKKPITWHCVDNDETCLSAGRLIVRKRMLNYLLFLLCSRAGSHLQVIHSKSEQRW